MNFHYDTDLWRNLQQCDRPVVLYGMGNGADKILNICGRYGIPVSDFFASDGFVRGHAFHGKTVLSYSDAKAKYGADGMVVLLSFASSLPDVLSLFDRVDAECELYAPDVPVCGDHLFCLDFVRENAEAIREAYSLLADEESRRIFEKVIQYKLSGRIGFLREAVSSKEEVYRDLLRADSIRTAVDLGAYNGDTVRELMTFAPRLETVYALEPDRRNFRKLSDFTEGLERPAVHAYQAAAWSVDTTLSFADSGNRNAGAFAKGKQVEVAARAIDSILRGAPVDYVKYDVEGAEAEALMGTAETIAAHKPRLLVSAYHRSEDLFALPLLIHRLNPDYRLYLRRYPYVPAWDLNLICL